MCSRKINSNYNIHDNDIRVQGILLYHLHEENLNTRNLYILKNYFWKPYLHRMGILKRL